ncbi:MAG: sigma-70 family RNA polymerase sigma factor, partial [Bacteroidota bacterium]
EVFDQYSDVIRNFMYYKCGNLAQAEDLTQDAFVKLWKNCSKVALDKAKSYVMKIAQNAFYNVIEHQKVVLKYQKAQSAFKANLQSPEFLMEEQEFLKQLERSIAKLPQKQREVFLLNRIDKKTYKEIAFIVGITQKAVERRMHLALLTLRKTIDVKL